MTCLICNERASRRGLCIQHYQDLEYFTANEYELSYALDFVVVKFVEIKRKELYGN